MGEVWKAQHQLLVRPAAIKLIRPEALGGDERSARTALQRFEREAQATSGLSSPHSIELYDFGVTESGTFYYVMELLSGIDLRTLVETHGPIPAERALHVLQQACHSLTDAHHTGIIHRDIKPGNIFVCRRGLDYDFVKVLDFGLVKHVQPSEVPKAQLSMQGVTSGTPGFMAPELAYGDREVDARADIYALGCVGYWLLTGKLVFEGDTALSVILQHAKDEPPPPSKRTELAIPGDVERLILACLEKRVERRPASALELAESLRACERNLPTPWSDERARRWWQTHLPQLARPTAAT